MMTGTSEVEAELREWRKKAPDGSPAQPPLARSHRRPSRSEEMDPHLQRMGRSSRI